jgi:hypothetical protein
VRGWGGSAGGNGQPAGAAGAAAAAVAAAAANRMRGHAPHATPLHASLPCRCMWLNFEGNEVPYTVLAPSERKRYSTWCAGAGQLPPAVGGLRGRAASD